MEEVFRAAGQAAWAEMLAPEVLASLSPPERWREAIEATDCEVWIVDDDGPVALAVLRRSQDDGAEPDTGEIDSFYAHPKVWGKGHARALMMHVIQRLASMGFREATLWTEERNHRPKAFYASCGWRPDGVVRHRGFRGDSLAEGRWRLTLH